MFLSWRTHLISLYRLSGHGLEDGMALSSRNHTGHREAAMTLGGVGTSSYVPEGWGGRISRGSLVKGMV